MERLSTKGHDCAVELVGIWAVLAETPDDK